MEVGISATVVDETTEDISDALSPVFEALSNQLKGEYGGAMEHLWISLELVEHHAKADGSARHPFRFQKRVSGRSHFGLPAIPDRFNVGSFSVRPDFGLVSTLPVAQAIPYVLSLIYQASLVLVEKQKKLDGFDAALFRTRLLAESQALGYSIKT